MERAEEQVEERKESGEIRGRGVQVMMVVVVAGGDDDAAQESKTPPHLYMREGNKGAVKNGDEGHEWAMEAEGDGGDVGSDDKEKGVEGVLSVGGEPIDVLGGVVHRVEAPEEAPRVTQSMGPVGEELTDQQYANELRSEGKRGEENACALRYRSAKHELETDEGQRERLSNADGVHEEVQEVGEPSRSSSPLPMRFGKPFDRHHQQSERQEE